MWWQIALVYTLLTFAWLTMFCFMIWSLSILVYTISGDHIARRIKIAEYKRRMKEDN